MFYLTSGGFFSVKDHNSLSDSAIKASKVYSVFLEVRMFKPSQDKPLLPTSDLGGYRCEKEALFIFVLSVTLMAEPSVSPFIIL